MDALEKLQKLISHLVAVEIDFAKDMGTWGDSYYNETPVTELVDAQEIQELIEATGYTHSQLADWRIGVDGLCLDGDTLCLSVTPFSDED